MPPQGGRKHPHQDFISLDTKNVLFMCGGAFVGLDKIVENRLGRREIGFGRKARDAEEIRQSKQRRRESSKASGWS